MHILHLPHLHTYKERTFVDFRATPHHFDPRAAFPGFYSNSVIRHLGQYAKWSVSDVNARPINVPALIDGRGVFGASQHKLATDAVTLDVLTAHLPEATNAAFFADASHDGVLIIDIEKTCPPYIAEQLLNLPGCYYMEVSKSGRGFHIIVPMPSDPATKQRLHATTLAALRAPAGVFEVLTYHWVTFTRNIVTASDMDLLRQHSRQKAANDQVADVAATDDQRRALLGDIDYSSVDALINSLFDYRQTQPADTLGYNEAIDTEAIDTARALPHYDGLCNTLVGAECSYTLDDYAGDNSRFEFAMLGWLHTVFTSLAFAQGVIAKYDAMAQAVIIYDALRRRIEHRPKHDELRDGMPLLLYSALRIVES